ncbi:MAG: hypothetical protein ABFD18_18345 [Syntrophomonas sp.]
MKEKTNETKNIRSKEMRMINREYDEIVFDSENANKLDDKNSLDNKKSE